MAARRVGPRSISAAAKAKGAMWDGKSTCNPAQRVGRRIWLSWCGVKSVGCALKVAVTQRKTGDIQVASALLHKATRENTHVEV